VCQRPRLLTAGNLEEIALYLRPYLCIMIHCNKSFTSHDAWKKNNFIVYTFLEPFYILFILFHIKANAMWIINIIYIYIYSYSAVKYYVRAYSYGGMKLNFCCYARNVYNDYRCFQFLHSIQTVICVCDTKARE